ncbi:RNase A-like domain-containing protein [Luteimonas arsenica]|uniref:RNase A-like domain-containing protein n=1 Tax=Luteimonas arsenica TaxID=1586242 RepID=UPI0010568845|nr:RNase A-like domain-containing protein [Luteimonas arsenica]
MDVARALSPATEWSLSALQAPAGRMAMAAASDPDADLAAHIQDLADAGEIEEFLGQVLDAIVLAGGDPTFGEHLDPLLGRIRDALGELDTRQLPRVERDAVEATLEELDAHLGTGEVDGPDGPDEPDGPGQVPGGGLEAHENVGGHLIERHVGKSEEWLVDRVRRENISAASSFRDLPEAEHFVAATLAEHQGRIDAWVDGQGGNRLVIDARFDASTGISVSRGDDSAEDVFSVRLVLERSNALDTGYRIVTGYPSAP